MSALTCDAPPFAGRALARLREWPALRTASAPGGGDGLAAGSRQIVHLHRPDEAEVCLTWPVIRRMNAALADSPQMRFVPGGDWVRVGLRSDYDVALLESLVSVAIQAHTRAGEQRRPGTPCPQSLRVLGVLVPAQTI